MTRSRSAEFLPAAFWMAAVLSACAGSTTDREKEGMVDQSSQVRSEVPLTRPLSLSTEAGTQHWEFTVGPAGENSGSSLVLGFRMCLPDSARSIAADAALVEAPPAVQVRLASITGAPPVEVALTQVVTSGHVPKAEFLKLPPDGEVRTVSRASLDSLALEAAGIDKDPTRCSTYAFALAMGGITPGRYVLTLTPKQSYSPPTDAELELIVAYSYLAK